MSSFSLGRLYPSSHIHHHLGILASFLRGSGPPTCQATPAFWKVTSALVLVHPEAPHPRNPHPQTQQSTYSASLTPCSCIHLFSIFPFITSLIVFLSLNLFVFFYNTIYFIAIISSYFVCMKSKKFMQKSLHFNFHCHCQGALSR